MTFGPGAGAEQHFVREALLSLGSERPDLRDAARAVRDWERVLAIAAAGSVAESIWSGMSLRGMEDEIPEPARSRLQDAHEGATARNALLLSEAAAIQAAFGAAGIESVILKGPGLLVAHYPDIGARHVGDVDVLVRPEDVERAVAVARRQGARPRAAVARRLGPKELPRGHHSRGSPVTAGRVSSSRSTRRSRGSRRRAHGRCADAARPRSFTGRSRKLRIPAAADLGAMACLHVFDSHGGLSDYLSRHLADIAVLIDSGRGPAWSEVAMRIPCALGLHGPRSRLPRPPRRRSRGGGVVAPDSSGFVGA